MPELTAVQKLTRILAWADDPVAGLAVLDKSVRLARCFGARVDVLVSASTTMVALTTHCSRHSCDEVTLCSVDGDVPVDALLLREALARHPDVVVKAAAGAHPLRRWSLDANDSKLAEDCPVPLLLVGSQPWPRTLRIAAAVDVSDVHTAAVTRSILHAAGYLVLGVRGALDVLYSEREEQDDTVRVERAVKLSQIVREYHVGSERLQILNGPPEIKLPPLIAAGGYDVLVLGAVSHRAGVAAWLAPLTGKLVEATTGDVLLVKSEASGLESASPPGARGSGSEQQADLCEEFV